MVNIIVFRKEKLLKKEAFSDGVSQTDNSWSDIIKDHVKRKIFNGAAYPEDDQIIIDMMVKEKKITHNIDLILLFFFTIV